MKIREMTADDVDAVAEVHKAAFPRQSNSLEWIWANYRASPRIQFFVATDGDRVLGFLYWAQKSGFRRYVVLELEQIGVLPEVQGRGIGEQLIVESLPLVRTQLARRGAVVKHLMVTTRADNFAQRLYRKTLGVETEAAIKDLYSADEVIMIRRNIDAGDPLF